MKIFISFRFEIFIINVSRDMNPNFINKLIANEKFSLIKNGSEIKDDITAQQINKNL